MIKAQEDNLKLSKLIQPIGPEHFFKTPGYYNWCPSIIKGGTGEYHLFYSRWKKQYTFSGWLPFSEIAHATSNSPFGPWSFKGVVLTGRGLGHWDAIGAHNPKIKFYEGKYYLYYISNNFGERTFNESELVDIAKKGSKHDDWMRLRNNQRTGVAVANSLNGPWTRLDSPIIEPSGPIQRLTVNPAIAQGPDKKYYLVVKGDKPGDKRFIRNQAVAISDSPLGPFQMNPEPVIDYLDTEDMSIWFDKRRRRFYGIFHATKGFLGMITSIDGINWEKAKEYVVNRKEFLLKNGRTLKPRRTERPFVLTDDEKPIVLSAAILDKNDSYLIFVPLAPNK